jgi:hypothetical protein
VEKEEGRNIDESRALSFANAEEEECARAGGEGGAPESASRPLSDFGDNDNRNLDGLML